MNNMCEQVLAIKRIEAVIEARNRLIEMHEGLVYVSETDSHKELSKAYEKFEQSYVDIIIAEAKYLESLKEGSSCTYKTPTYANNLEYGHKKQPSVLNKDIDIDGIVEYMSKELKEGIKL
jgi:hypothetical protein